MSMHVTKKLGGSILLKGAKKVQSTGKRGEFKMQLDGKEIVLKAIDDETAEKWVDAIKYSIRGKAGRTSLRAVSMPSVSSKRRSTLKSVEFSLEDETAHLTHLKNRAETGDFWERKASLRREPSENTIPEEYDNEFAEIHMAPPSTLVEQGSLPPPPPLPSAPPTFDHTYTVSQIDENVDVAVAMFCSEHGIQKPASVIQSCTDKEVAVFCQKHSISSGTQLVKTTSSGKSRLGGALMKGFKSGKLHEAVDKMEVDMAEEENAAAPANNGGRDSSNTANKLATQVVEQAVTAALTGLRTASTGLS